MTIKTYLSLDERYRAAVNEPTAFAKEERRLRLERDRIQREARLFFEGLLWGVLASTVIWAILIAWLWL